MKKTANLLLLLCCGALAACGEASPSSSSGVSSSPASSSPESSSSSLEASSSSSEESSSEEIESSSEIVSSSKAEPTIPSPVSGTFSCRAYEAISFKFYVDDEAGDLYDVIYNETKTSIGIYSYTATYDESQYLYMIEKTATGYEDPDFATALAALGALAYNPAGKSVICMIDDYPVEFLFDATPDPAEAPMVVEKSDWVPTADYAKCKYNLYFDPWYSVQEWAAPTIDIVDSGWSPIQSYLYALEETETEGVYSLKLDSFQWTDEDAVSASDATYDSLNETITIKIGKSTYCFEPRAE